LAQTETLITVSAMIARKNNGKRRDISKKLLVIFWIRAAWVYKPEPEEKQVRGPRKLSGRFR
jgi:hypothetical protein